MEVVTLPLLAVVAGLVSFSSPCCLPLIPGYLSSMSTLPVAELGDRQPRAVIVRTSVASAERAGVRLSDGHGVRSGLGPVHRAHPRHRHRHRRRQRQRGVGCAGARVHSIGLGSPFVLLALDFHRAQRSMAWLRRHGPGIDLAGGAAQSRRARLRALVRFQKRHDQLGDATVVGVVYDDTAPAVRAFRAEEGGTSPLVMDPDGRTALSYGVAGVPESYLVSPDGFVVSKIVGGVTLDALDALERLVAEAKRKFQPSQQKGTRTWTTWCGCCQYSDVGAA